MNLLRCATHIVGDIEAAIARFTRWLDYRVVELGALPGDLAAAWGTPASAWRRYAVLQPASGANVFLRLIEGDPVPDYWPIRTFGWAAIEICVEDVLAVNARMLEPDSPYRVIGPPTRIAGFDTIFPMQVRGPDHETLYFTEIAASEPDSGLPNARSPIDTPFILVLACADMPATADWFAGTLRLDMTDPVVIRYSMINQAFELSDDTQHAIVTARWRGDIFLEFDQYPDAAVTRPAHDGALPPGVSICTLFHPAFDTLDVAWFSAPVERDGVIYAGRRVGVLKTPEGALLEVVEG